VTRWEPRESGPALKTPESDEALKILNKNLFCTFLGTLYKNQELYQKIKSYIEIENPYLFKMYDECNQ
jgi:hypothetical protein